MFPVGTTLSIKRYIKFFYFSSIDLSTVNALIHHAKNNVYEKYIAKGCDFVTRFLQVQFATASYLKET